MIQLGIETLLRKPPKDIGERRIGLLCNPASVDSTLCRVPLRIDAAFPGRLKALFTPQHGYHAAKQDNMIESPNTFDADLKIPVFSLYGRHRVPTDQALDMIDILLVDLQDVGTRVYTFASTMSLCMEAARVHGKKVVVLDRPNPVGGEKVEGNCLDPQYASFVGRYPIPMRHGLTIGELALLFNGDYGIGCELDVIPMCGWSRSMYFRETGLHWVAPSPNLPTPEAALVYPGQVIWEGTNISEGRGTTLPFELFGAPFMDPHRLGCLFHRMELPGIILRPAAFEPTWNKWQNRLCHGFQIHVTDPKAYSPFLTSLRLLSGVRTLWPQDFAYKPPPYEYEFERLPIDLILGARNIREAVENTMNPNELEAIWKDDLRRFCEITAKVRLYR